MSNPSDADIQAAHKLGIEVVTVASLIEHRPFASFNNHSDAIIRCECGWIEGVPSGTDWLDHFREVTKCG